MQRSRSSMVLAVISAIALSTPATAGSSTSTRADLTDLSSDAAITDGAWAVASATVTEERTRLTLNVKQLQRSAAGSTLGAHVHVGPCVAGDGAAAGPHYNHGGGVSDQTEVWLDFRVTNGGTGHATAIVPFAIPPGGARSVVIHALPTSPDGSAGARMACLPLEL